MLTAIPAHPGHEIRTNPKILVFGEDVGRKGGVARGHHGIAGRIRRRAVFDTSLFGRRNRGQSVGMALAGLRPVAEIQFRKYAEPATDDS